MGSGREGHLLAVAAGLGVAAVVVARHAWRASRKGSRKGSRKQGPPADPVSASGRVIAAWRALESLEPAPLFQDPFAAAVAGSAAVHDAIQAARPFPATEPGADALAAQGASPEAAEAEAASLAAGEQQPQAPPPRRRFCFSNVGARVWWFDRQLAAALASSSAPRQVVVLGAGFDTRPWRMALPAGVSWFEVDMPEVLEAKRKLLSQLGAGFDSTSPAGCLHPLRAAAWSALEADLCQPGWTAALVARGLDTSQPIVWVAEGLLMYLSSQEVAAVLKEMAGASPAGSFILAHNITEELLARIQHGDTAYAPFSPELVATWRSGFPPASDPVSLAAVLHAAGWRHLLKATSRARIAAHICDGRHGGDGGRHDDSRIGVEAVAAQCDFEARPDEGGDRCAVFLAASK